MEFNLKFAMDNAAFEDDAGAEVARILREVADNSRRARTAARSAILTETPSATRR